MMHNIIFMSMMAVLLACETASAITKNFAWDANTESDLAGYNLYRAPMDCTNPTGFSKVASFGKVTTGTVTWVGDGEYCFALTAIDTANLESVQSNRVGVTVNENPPASPQNLRTVVP